MRLADMTINFYFFFKIQGEKNKRHKRHTRLNPLCHKAFRVWRLLYPNATHATKTPHTGPNATLVLRDIVATPLPQCLLAGIRPTSASTWRDSPAAAKDSVPLTRSEVCSPVGPEPRHYRLNKAQGSRRWDPCGDSNGGGRRSPARRATGAGLILFFCPWVAWLDAARMLVTVWSDPP
jgi:hypothetical protein